MAWPDILIFFGAGASRAAYRKMPLVRDFFLESGKIIEEELSNATPIRQLIEKTKPLWDFLHCIEHLSWDGFSNAIHSGTSWNSLKPGHGNIWGDGNGYPEISQSLKNIISTPVERNEREVLGALRTCTYYLINNRPHNVNIEEIITRIESYAYTKRDEEPRKLMQKFIVWLFASLGVSDGIDYSATPHSKLLSELMSKGLLNRAVLVSFNYDVVLERSMNTLNNLHWNSICGYGFDVPGYFSMQKNSFENSGAKREQGNVCLLKPHGSLAWIMKNDQIYPIVDDRKHIAGRPSIPKGEELWEIYNQIDESPVIIPPGRIKRLYGKHSWQTWKVLGEALQHCSKVVVIGWNIPDTDNDIKDRLIRNIDNRREENQIEKLIVCDKGMPDVFYDKFSMLFLPQRNVEKLNDGFEDKDAPSAIVEKLLK